jgi:lysine 2,3-aminomutase
MPLLPVLCPDPGIVWLAAGLPAQSGGLAAQRSAALFPAAPGGPPSAGEALAGAREVTLLPSAGGNLPPLEDRLPGLRARATQPILRLELWLEAPCAPLLSPALLGALVAAQPLFVHAVLTRAAGLPAGAGPLFRRLAEAGVPSAAEIVLRRGEIDGSGAVRALCLALLRHGVRPYFLVDGAWLDPARRVPRAGALEIVRALRGWISGLAVPQWVEEGRDGRRVPVIPPYVERLDGEGVEVVNYEGRRLRYANPPDDPG